MIHLAHFVTHPVQYFAPLYRELAERPGVELTVLFGSRHGLAPSFDVGFGREVQFDVPLLAGYAHRFLPNRGPGTPTRGFGQFDCPEVESILRDGACDAVWVHGWGYRVQWQVIRAARRLGIPFLMRAETPAVGRPRGSWRWLATRLRLGGTLRSAAACLFVGRSNREFYRGMGVAEARLFPAHYSVDARRFREQAGSPEDRRSTRRQWGASPDTFVVVCAAKAVPRKRLQDAIQAVGRLGPAAHLWLLGDGAERQTLEQLAYREAPGRVMWHGFVNQSEMPARLAAADAFVLPSEDEPWGLAVNEAMAVGLPVVGSDRLGCAADLIRPGETGYVHPVGDVAALAKGLAGLEADPERRVRMGRAAQVLVLRDYDVRATADQVVAAVHAVVRPRAAVRA